MDDEELIPFDISAPAPGRPVTYVRVPEGFEFKNLIPRTPPAERMPFRAGGLTIEGSFDIELYLGAAERLDEMTRNHPDYCSICEGFPCHGGHPPTD